MIGNSSSQCREYSVHFQAARDWLSKAEKELASGQEVMAAAILMLAQAELKLAIEKVAEGARAKPISLRKKPVFRSVPIARGLAIAAALAACFALGIYMGRASTPGEVIKAPEVEAPLAIVESAPQAVQPEETNLTLEEEASTLVAEKPEEIAQEEEPSVPRVASVRPRIRRGTEPSPVRTGAPEATFEPVTSKAEEIVVVATLEPEAASSMQKPEAAAAEVTLETVRALSERLLQREAME